MAILTRQQILDAQDRATETVKVPEWGDDAEVIVRSMTGKERNTYELQFADKDDAHKPKGMEAMTYLIVATTVDASGKALFTADDIPPLIEKNAAVLARIFNSAIKLNAIGPQQTQELKGN